MSSPAMNLVRIGPKHKVVPETCALDPLVVVAAIFHNQHPCDECDHDRGDCGGLPRKDKAP